ncbi:MAG TPA: hypothetical protein VMN04_04735 [Thermoanaerobaculia bacterium]|nr:hypothetical protein [Thermoanaerobaculia bacterium]
MVVAPEAMRDRFTIAAITFMLRDFPRTGIPLTIAAYLLVLLLGATYWKWLGLV